jgi:hypothetical protein
MIRPPAHNLAPSKSRTCNAAETIHGPPACNDAPLEPKAKMITKSTYLLYKFSQIETLCTCNCARTLPAIANGATVTESLPALPPCHQLSPSQSCFHTAETSANQHRERATNKSNIQLKSTAFQSFSPIANKCFSPRKRSFPCAIAGDDKTDSPKSFCATVLPSLSSVTTNVCPSSLVQ